MINWIKGLLRARAERGALCDRRATYSADSHVDVYYSDFGKVILYGHGGPAARKDRLRNAIARAKRNKKKHSHMVAELTELEGSQ